MIEVSYHTVSFMIVFYILCIFISFYCADRYFSQRIKIKTLLFEVEIRDILIDGLLKKGQK